MSEAWNSQLYDKKHGFVSKYGEEVVSLLAPQRGEHILDLGCGTGDLARKIAEEGAWVTGIDNSEKMLEAAREKYPEIEFIHASADNFELKEPVDAVFSNATLHWVPNKEAAAENIYNCLKDGGRFVAEFGGKGNVEGIIDALSKNLEKNDYNTLSPSGPWYFPSIGEYASLLEKTGFKVKYAVHFDRQTPLEGEGGMFNWLRMFARSILKEVDEEKSQEILEKTVEMLKSSHLRGGTWFADYKRIRISAIKIVSTQFDN